MHIDNLNLEPIHLKKTSYFQKCSVENILSHVVQCTTVIVVAAAFVVFGYSRYYYFFTIL